MLLCHSVKYRKLFTWSRCIGTLFEINWYKDTNWYVANTESCPI